MSGGGTNVRSQISAHACAEIREALLCGSLTVGDRITLTVDSHGPAEREGVGLEP